LLLDELGSFSGCSDQETGSPILLKNLTIVTVLSP
jgi:hypothetical protein